jgi:phospholipase/carboxylesterase
MKSLVIFLHGVGSRGSDLAPLAASWRDALPHTVFAMPDAPFPFGQGGPGRQWFSVAGVTEANRGDRIVAARESFDTIFRNIVAEHALSDHLDRVALVGFSQGSIMALDVVATGRWPVASVVAFAGRLASPEPLTPSLRTRTLFLHGDADTVIPAWESERAESRLRQLGVDATRRVLPRLGHSISSEGAEAAVRFLAETFSPVE